MLAYPSYVMQRPSFAAAALPHQHYPHAAVSLSPPFAFPSSQPPPSFALHATAAPLFPQLPSPATPTRHEQQQPTSHSDEDKEADSPSAAKKPCSSFSIASILGTDDKSLRKERNSPAKTVAVHHAHLETVSPSTPLSAGAKPGNFYYFYPPHPPSPFSPFAAAHSCLDSERLARITAPVAVINEIVRGAGKQPVYSIVPGHTQTANVEPALFHVETSPLQLFLFCCVQTILMAPPTCWVSV